MPKSPKDSEVVEALSPFKPPKDDAPNPEVLANAIVRELLSENATVELEDLPGLEDEDGTARARQTYVLSYLRILDFLRRSSGDFNQRHKQAVLAMSFLKHAESHNLELLQLGRGKDDGKLLAKVEKLQASLEAQSQFAIEQDRRHRSLNVRPDQEVAEGGPSQGSKAEGAAPTEDPATLN